MKTIVIPSLEEALEEIKKKCRHSDASDFAIRRLADLVIKLENENTELKRNKK